MGTEGKEAVDAVGIFPCSAQPPAAGWGRRWSSVCQEDAHCLRELFGFDFPPPLKAA